MAIEISKSVIKCRKYPHATQHAAQCEAIRQTKSGGLPTAPFTLQKLRQLEGNRQSGYVLSAYTTKEKSLSLDYLARQIKPILAAKGIEWKGGYYPQRHGISTKIKAKTRDTLAASGMLRHSDVATTERNYIHTVPENTRKAMQGNRADGTPQVIV